MRKLASIQKVVSLNPIQGADKIEVAQILGWEVVVKKGEFKVGDLVVYIEIDSIVPDRPEFEFLKDRKFRVRTIKLRKQISQGIAFPLKILPQDNKYQEDDDVTEILGIKKYDPQLAEENKVVENAKSKSIILKFMMQLYLFRLIYFVLNKKDKGWPAWIQKTDEDRIQICTKILKYNVNKPFYITEKLDGQSATYYTVKQKKWGFNKLTFGICSRNVKMGKRDNSTYWQIESRYDIGKKMLQLKKNKFVIQGEIVGGKVQGNKYQLNELDFYVFNIIENGKKYSAEQMIAFCENNGLKYVPIVNKSWVFQGSTENTNDDYQVDIKPLVEMSIGKSVLNKDIWREGLVFRLVENPSISFKVINPEFLLKYGG